MSQKLPGMLETTIQKIREMVDVNSVVGEPITTPDGVTIIPVSRISIGLGGGGTDFRAAFERIDALIASGALRGLRGALFFSDGRGIFPSSPPEYETTFVFLKHRFDAIDVPVWVRRLVLDAPPPQGGEYIEY